MQLGVGVWLTGVQVFWTASRYFVNVTLLSPWGLSTSSSPSSASRRAADWAGMTARMPVTHDGSPKGRRIAIGSPGRMRWSVAMTPVRQGTCPVRVRLRRRRVARPDRIA